MSTNGGDGALRGENSTPTLVTAETVRQRELLEIARRRRCASSPEQRGIQPDSRSEDLTHNLVGLSLSGGGMRSGAFSLGVLQALYERRVLPFVDYLSTVSGGGYAGAYLSSVALRQYQQSFQSRGAGADRHGELDTASPREAEETAADDSAATPPSSDPPADASQEGALPIAQERNGKQPPRVLKFIYGGTYLRRTWLFLNRYLMGLLLIWTVVFSALIAIASLTAFAFRCLDYPSSRAWLGALGFRGDVRLAFFPSFVLLIVWLILWGISYFKYGRRATGNTAQIVFYLLVITTLIAVAALFGTGQNDLSSVLALIGLDFSEQTVKRIENVTQTLMFSVIGASLLPYLNPQRLLRSGMDPQKSWEKLSFWIASRALLYGVPFVLFAIFAQENISRWNDHRDSRLQRSEILSWDRAAALWRQVEDYGSEEQERKDAAAMVNLGNLVLLPERVRFSPMDADTEATRAHQRDMEQAVHLQQIAHRRLNTLSALLAKVEEIDLASRIHQHHNLQAGELDTPRTAAEPTETESRESGVVAPPKDRVAAELEATLQSDPDSLTALRHQTVADDFELSFAARWWSLVKLAGDLVGDVSHEDRLRNPVYQIQSDSNDRTRLTTRAAAELNQGLSHDAFYKTLLPTDYLPALTAVAADGEGATDAPAAEQTPQGSNQAATITTAVEPTGELAADTSPNERAAGAREPAAVPRLDVTNRHVVPANVRGVLDEFSRVASQLPAGDGDRPDPQAWARQLLTVRRQAERVQSQNALVVATAKFPPTAREADVLSLCDMSDQELDQWREEHDLEDAWEARHEGWLLASEQVRRATFDINRQLLKAYYGKSIQDKSVVYSSVVLNRDQATRLQWFVGALAVFLIAGSVVDMNATSGHGFYSNRIGEMWIEGVSGFREREVALARLETTGAGYPYHLINCALHQFGRRLNVGSGLPRSTFLFSKLYCGSSRTNYQPTAEYMQGTYALDDAIAISGAAVSPVQTSNPLILALLFLGNLRMGQWVANPNHRSNLPGWLQRWGRHWPVTPLRLLACMLQPAEYRPFCFVADGGHVENLGIGALLKRRCRLIIAVDAGYDPQARLDDLTKVIRWARVGHGVEIVSLEDGQPLDFSKLVPDADTRLAEDHFVVARIKYPANQDDGPSEGYLVYVKASLNGDEPHDLRHFHKTNPDFPHTPSADQFFDPDRFESYRELGFHIAETLCDQRLPDSFARDEPPTVEAFIEKFVAVAPERVPRKPRARTKAPAKTPR